ncbi:hypothetical protein M9H77_29838 [Catharanthus roseus]|uniref:Uncharacterized protein n=1 Tax=Catharanthus roseus TaxID=4058 RepID=A0ACB9ZZF3_CATRO|nr:hypothetical protein M9H77_29838 [Catharanthus roseus]
MQLRRERIAERIRALQELVPSVNKTDRAVMLDEIVDYVKFLRLQVKSNEVGSRQDVYPTASPAGARRSSAGRAPGYEENA